MVTLNKIIDKMYSVAYQTVDSVSGLFDNRSIEVLVEEELEKHMRKGTKTVLFIGTKYDYGRRHSGLAYEHYNYYCSLVDSEKYSVIYFDYDRLKQKYGKKRMSQMLREAAYRYNPEFLFYFHFLDWVNHDVWRELSKESPTKTIVWVSDDNVRYEESRKVWEMFDLVVTPDLVGYRKRKEEGFDNTMLGQWGCNHYLYRKLGLPKKYDVTFIGQCYGGRKEFVEKIKSSGIDITAFGRGWENGRVSQSDLIKIINQSRICLDIIFTSKNESIFMIKGRAFEVPGCGSVLLTKDTKEIAEYFIPGKEILTYSDENDAIDKIRQYLKNEKQLEEIAERGQKRVIKEHTIDKRFADMFDAAEKVKKS